MAFNLNSWLRKTPQPVAVLVDDKQRVEVPKNGRSWRDLTNTISAMGATKLACLDAQGGVLRATVIEDSEEEGPVKSQDMTDLQFFGKLLAEAHESGGKKSEPLLNTAMQFIDRQAQRLVKAEHEIDRLRNLVHKLNAELALPLEEPAGEAGLVPALMEGIAAAAAAQQATPQVTPIKKVRS
jgi:hypothetical protein